MTTPDRLPCPDGHPYSRTGSRTTCRICRSIRMRANYYRRKGTPPPTHGANGYFNYGCRCAVCKAAGMAYQAELRRRAGAR